MGVAWSLPSQIARTWRRGRGRGGVIIESIYCDTPFTLRTSASIYPSLH